MMLGGPVVDELQKWRDTPGPWYQCPYCGNKWRWDGPVKLSRVSICTKRRHPSLEIRGCPTCGNSVGLRHNTIQKWARKHGYEGPTLEEFLKKERS
jgi:hypothetical protein